MFSRLMPTTNRKLADPTASWQPPGGALVTVPAAPPAVPSQAPAQSQPPLQPQPPQPPPIPGNLTPAEQDAFLRQQGQVYNVRHKTAAVYLQATTQQIMPQYGLGAFVGYFEQLQKEASNSADPIEQLLLQQIVLAHHAIGQLYVRAAATQMPEATATYMRAAAGLTSEFRRLTLAWKAYREPTPAKNVVLVKQQNVAQNQQVAFVDGDGAKSGLLAAPENANDGDIELTSNGAIEHAPHREALPQSQTRGRRKKEPLTAAWPDRKRTTTPA